MASEKLNFTQGLDVTMAGVMTVGIIQQIMSYTSNTGQPVTPAVVEMLIQGPLVFIEAAAIPGFDASDPAKITALAEAIAAFFTPTPAPIIPVP